VPEESKVRISEELYEKVRQIAEKQGRTIKEVVEEAIKAFILGIEQVDKPIKSVTGKIIPLQYDAKCRICGRQIKAGELAYWAKYTYTDGTSKSYVICLDCYYKDTALAEQYLRKKKLEAVVRGLQKKADELVEQVEKLQAQYDLQQLKSEIFQFWRNVKDAVLSDPNVLKNIDKFFNELNALIERLNAVEAALTFGEEPKKRKRKAEAIEKKV